MMKPIRKILLIDDDYISNVITQVQIETLGLCREVKVAHNGKEGLEMLQDSCFERSVECPDLILLDINMPVMNGFEFLEQLELRPATCCPAIVMYTSSDDPRDVEKALSYQKVIGFITKPFEMSKIEPILSKLGRE